MKATMPWRFHACDDFVKDYLCVPCLSNNIIVPNVIPPNHVDDLPVVEPNQPNDVIVIPEPVLVNKDEDPEEEEFEEEEEPQEEEEDMDIYIEEDENEPELTFPYEEANPLNPPPPASDSVPEDVIEVEDTVEPEDEIVPASVHEVGESSTAPFLREDSDGLFPSLMRRHINSLFSRITSISRQLCGHETAHALVEKKGKAKDEYYGKIILDLGNKVRSSMEEGTAVMENLVRKLGNDEERVECKKLKKELEEARFSNILLRMQNERVDRDLYWTIVQAHEIMPPKSAPLTQSVIRRMIKESVNAAIAAERTRHANARNNASGSGQARAVELRRWFEKTEMTFGISECAEDKKVKFDAATLIENKFWNLKVKEYNMVAYTQRFNELALMCPRMVEPKSVKVDAYIQGLSDNIKGEITSSKLSNLNEAMRMAYKLMEQKLQARNERIIEGNKRKWENFQSGNNSGNAQDMTTASNEGKVSSGSLPVYEHCFTRHVWQCWIKCHKCGKIRHKARYCKEKNVATGENTHPVWTCYDCGELGHTRNRCLRKVKQEETEEVHGRAYAIKDAKPHGPNVVTGTFLPNNRYSCVLFDSGSDRSFVDTRFSYMLDIDPVKIDTIYEVELADGRLVSTNTVLKGCTLNLVNHLFKIDLMPIKLGTFDVITGMDWLVKHDAVIVCGEKVVRIPYGNKTLTIESNKGVSRLKVISCIKARKYIERGCHLFLAHLNEKKPKEKRLEDVPVIRDFLEVFLDDLLGLPPPRQVEFRIDLVPRAAPVARAPYRLTPSEMRELSKQLRELLEKGFIRPNSLP
ncbi:putative reverse transcriptase domain-containing protein [Tanacetum coccineum]